METSEHPSPIRLIFYRTPFENAIGLTVPLPPCPIVLNTSVSDLLVVRSLPANGDLVTYTQYSLRVRRRKPRAPFFHIAKLLITRVRKKPVNWRRMPSVR